MSSGKMHKVGFAAAFLVLIWLLTYFRVIVLDDSLYFSLAVAFGAGLIGAVWPDIDIGTSTIRVKVTMALLIWAMLAFAAFYQGWGVTYFLLGVLPLVFLLLLTTSKHRQFCHSISFLVLMTVIVFLMAEFGLKRFMAINSLIVAGGWFLGQFMHLAMDGELKQGGFGG